MNNTVNRRFKRKELCEIIGKIKEFLYTNKTIVKACIITFILSFITGFIIISYIIKSVENKYDEKISEINTVFNIAQNKLEDDLNEQVEINDMYLKEINTVNSELDKANSIIKEFENRSELFNKYEIAVMNTNNSRTSLTYDDIEYVEKTANDFNVPADLLFYIMKIESNFNPSAKSSVSSATGAMQIIEGTGESIHYNILGRTTPYDHNIQLDFKTNVYYGAAYLGYLFENYGDIDEVIMRYSGGYSKNGIGRAYNNKLNETMVLFNDSLASIQYEYDNN